MESERIQFRPYTMADLDFYAALVADPQVMRYISDGSTRTRQEAEERLRQIIGRYGQGTGTGLMLLVRKEDQVPVGHAGLVEQNVEGAAELEIGYWIAPAYWGQGFATEAAAALRDEGLQRRSRLISLIQPGNLGSAKVARRIGMTHERDVDFKGTLVGLYSIERAD